MSTVGAMTYLPGPPMYLDVHSTDANDLGLYTVKLTGTNGIWVLDDVFTVNVTVKPCYYAVITPQP